MSKPIQRGYIEAEKDLVLQEVWRAKETFAAERDYDLRKLFEELREKQRASGHRVVNLQDQKESVA